MNLPYAFVVTLCMLLRFSLANMPGCENEPYHDESYHPAVRVFAANPLSSNKVEVFEETFSGYVEELNTDVSKENYEELASTGGGRNLHTNREDVTCIWLCVNRGCSYCVQYDYLFGLTCSTSQCRRRLKHQDEESQRYRDLAAVPYTSKRNCFTDLQDSDCAAQMASMRISAQEKGITIQELKCFLVPSV